MSVSGLAYADSREFVVISVEMLPVKSMAAARKTPWIVRSPLPKSVIMLYCVSFTAPTIASINLN